MRLRREDGASAVELALLTPLLCILIFGMIQFGIAFLQVQSIRTAVREGGRAAAVGFTTNEVRQKTVEASVGSIPNGQESNVGVSPGQCTPNTMGNDVTVSYDTGNLPGGGVQIQIPFLPDMSISPVISAAFRCEV